MIALKFANNRVRFKLIEFNENICTKNSIKFKPLNTPMKAFSNTVHDKFR